MEPGATVSARGWCPLHAGGRRTTLAWRQSHSRSLKPWPKRFLSNYKKPSMATTCFPDATEHYQTLLISRTLYRTIAFAMH
jgi:hypothetical protein